MLKKVGCFVPQHEKWHNKTESHKRVEFECQYSASPIEEDIPYNIEHSKKLVRITCEGNVLRNLIPFGQTRLNKFGG
jgi:hypothetical protein